MSFHDDVEATCEWYRTKRIARIFRGGKDEPTFTGRLLDDPTGSGTRIALDAVVVPQLCESFAYDAETRKIPFLLDRVQHHGGIGFVLVKRGPDVVLVTDVRTLVFGRHIVLDGLPTVEHAPSIQDCKAVVIYNFLTTAIDHCVKRVPE